MLSDRRGLHGLARSAFVATLLLCVTSACSALVGGGALLGAVAVGALTSRCYDYLDVTVFDMNGHKTCAATVTASNGGDQSELVSCYYAPLTDGRWTLRASLPGVPDAISTVEVEHTHDCTRHVQTVELTLNRESTSLAPKAALPPPPAAIALPPPPPAVPTVSVPPAAASAAVDSAIPTIAPPTSSATPPVGVFPDRSETQH